MRKKFSIPSQFILAVLTILCVILLFAGYALDFTGGPLQTAAGYFFVPMQKGISYVTNRISISSQDAKSRQELIEENERLTREVESLRMQLSEATLEQNELKSLRQLFDLKDTYTDYEMTGARVIGGSTTSWFSSFIIDKGTADGVRKDMNVISGNGLVGIVTEAGTHYAKVRAIIDENASVSAMLASTGDHCIVSGSLRDMTSDGLILFSALEDTDDSLKAGDALVTSQISDKYLPGLLIGYVVTASEDPNRLTKSGTLVPVVDFRHLQEVLVILQVKETEDPE